MTLDEQRMSYLVAENARLDALHASILSGETIPGPKAAMQVYQDGCGGFWTPGTDDLGLVPAPRGPRRKAVYLGKAWTDGPIAKALHSDIQELMRDCTCSRCVRFRT